MFKQIDLEEAARLFRTTKITEKKGREAIGFFFLLPDFEIKKPITIDFITINPTQKTQIESNTVAYVSKVEFDESVLYRENSQYFQACTTRLLSAILSLSSERPVKWYWSFYNLKHDSSDIGIHHPLQSHGPGAVEDMRMDEDTFNTNILENFNILKSIKDDDYDNYIKFLRLFQLAQINKNNDFSLAFSLIVAAVESVAAKTITIDEVMPNWKIIEEKFNAFISDSEELKGDLNSLKNNIKHSHLKKRLILFIKKNIKIDELYLPNRYENDSYLDEITIENSKKQDFYNYHFDKFSKEEKDKLTDKLISDTYKYRSKLLHEGTRHPNFRNSTTNRYFDDTYIKDKNPKISYKELKHLNNANNIWQDLLDKKIVSNKKINLDKTEIILNHHYNGQGQEVRSLLNNKSYEIVLTISFTFFSKIAHISIKNHYSSSVDKLTE